MPTELAPTEVDAVELSWARVQAMRNALEAEPALLGPWAREREIELIAVEGGLMLHGRWQIDVQTPGWIADTLLGPGIELRSAILGSEPAPVITLPGHTMATMLVAWVERPVELSVRAFIPDGALDRLELGLLPATRGRLRVAIPGRAAVPVVDQATGEAAPVLARALGATKTGGDVVWSGASTLTLELRDPEHAPPAREVLAVAHAGVGLTVGDAEVRGRAHLQWELRHGALPRVRASVAGIGDDLTVEGPDVARWSRSGDALEVELSAPVSTRVDLELRWTQAIAAGDEARLTLPRIEPDAWRSESSLQLARDGELEVIPEITEGTAISAASLPAWGQGLVEGTPTAAYQRAGAPAEGHLDLLRFVPVPGPPTVIDVATYTIATTEEGRVLMKAHFDLRNDRGAHLNVRPPPGLRIIGARVGNDTALPSRGDDDAWRIPLRRSLETVDGLLSFPVEVILLGEQDPWERRERRELALPTLDAPVAASRVTVYLPPRYESRLEEGEHNVVGAFGEGEGLAYGRGVGMDDTGVTDALFEEAVEGYLSNDFEAAQEKLAQLQELGVSSENMARLQANIDVIEGKADAKDKGDLTLQRRVKEQAKARASDDFRRQESLIAEAEKAADAGDYAQAEAQYQAALDLGGKLAKLEQTESVEQDVRNADVEIELETVSKKKGKKGKQLASRREKTVADWSKGQSFYDPGDSSEAPVATATFGNANGAVGGLDGPTGGEEVYADDGRPAHGFDETPVEPDTMAALEDEPMSEPEPMPEPDEDYDQVYDVADEAPAPSRFARRGRGRVKFKRAPSRFARGLRGGGSKNTDGGGDATAVAVYDFEDDNVDGEILRPEGANLSSRAHSKTASMITTPATLATPDDLAPAEAVFEPSAEPTREPVDDQTRSRPDDSLPAPTVTASALSVVIPATGQAVRYQQLLIDANQTQVIEIHARRRLRR